jgi:hypothetical protein
MDLRLGTYQIWLPPDATVNAKVLIPPVEGVGKADTVWEMHVGNYTLFIHMDCNREPEDLGEFILSSTKHRPTLKSIEINGIHGVTHGTYYDDYKKRSWIDFWLKKGELLLCINLQSYTPPTESDKDLHQKILNSIQYMPTGNS